MAEIRYDPGKLRDIIRLCDAARTEAIAFVKSIPPGSPSTVKSTGANGPRSGGINVHNAGRYYRVRIDGHGSRHYATAEQAAEVVLLRRHIDF